MANLLSTSIDGQLTVNSGRLLLQTGGTNTYGIISGYNNNNHFITMRGSVSGSTSSPTFGGAHQMTFVEYAESGDSTGWYFKSSSSGTYQEIARITRSGINWSGNNVIHSGNIGSQSVSYASSSGTFSTGRTNYKDVTDNAVAGQLMWKNYGNNHTIFDASNSTSPDGGGVNNTNPDVAWTGTYPTLMGWNGANTYGVRVDSSRNADYAGNAGALSGLGVTSFLRDDGWNTYPGQDANTQGEMRVDFTYSNNAPYTGELIRFGSSGYSTQFNTSYGNSDNFAFRTRNGDTASWNAWRAVIHSGNIGSQSVSYASNADTVDSLHASDFVRAYTTTSDNIDSNWGQSFKTFDPVPSGTPPIASPNLRTINIGESFSRRTQLAFDYATDRAWFRRRDDGGWQTWREFIHSGNISSQSVSYATSAGNSSTTSQIVFNDLKINFPSGAGGGHSFASNHYSMGLDSGNGGWDSPHYRDLIIGYHTGVRIGANYSGIRFYDNSPTTDANNDGNGDGGEKLLMTIGGYVGTANQTDVVVNNNLFANVSMRAPIFYDSNDTTYYLDPSSTTSIRTAGSWRSDSSAWDGEYAGKIQYHGNWWYFQSLNGWIFRRENGVEPFTFNQNGNLNIYGNSNAPINITGSSDKYITINPGNGYEAMVRYIGGSGSSWYVGKRMADQLVNTASFHFYSEAAGATVGGITIGGDMYASGSMRAPIFYDSNNTYYYVDPNATSQLVSTRIIGGELRFHNGEYYNNLGNWGARFYSQDDGNGVPLYVQVQWVSGWNTALKIASGIDDNNPSLRTYGRTQLATDGGFVGVATTSPVAELDVNGRIVVRGGNRLYWGVSSTLGSWTTAQYASGSTHRFNANSFEFTNEGYGSSTFVTINSGGLLANTLYGGDVYTNGGWFRNHSNNNGIYWSATGWHLMPHNASDFRIHSGSASDVSLRFETGGTTRGYVYADSANTIGFLNEGRTWRLRAHSGGAVESFGDFRAPIFYDSADTTYFLDPNADFAMRVYGEICNSNYADGKLQPGALNIGRTDTNYAWDGSSWAGDVRLGILINASETWEMGIHDSGDSVMSLMHFDGGSTITMGRNIGWGQCTVNSPQGYVSNGNAWGTSNSAFFPNGITTAGGTNWIYGFTYIGNAPANGNGHEFNANGTQYSTASITTPAFIVNSHSDNTRGYRIHNTSGTAVSAMFTNSANSLVLAAGALDQVQMNKKVFISGAALGVNIAASATAGRIDASNDIVAYSTSDERFKENITPISNALDKVKTLTGVEFDWRMETKDYHGYVGHDVGVIAQQVKAVLPEAVRTNANGYLAVRYEKLIGLLIEGMKEQQEQIEELKAKLDGIAR